MLIGDQKLKKANPMQLVDPRHMAVFTLRQGIRDIKEEIKVADAVRKPVLIESLKDMEYMAVCCS